MPNVSVIVLSWNGLHLLKKCLPALTRQSFKDFEIILVDNGSIDNTNAYIKNKYPTIRIVRLEENAGFAGGVNAGVKASRSKYIALINNDAIPDFSWLKELVKAIESDKNIGTVSTMAENVYQDFRAHKDFVWGTSCFFGQNMILDLDDNPINNKKEMGKTKVDLPILLDSFGMAGGGCIFRREIPFDDTYFAYSEDTSFGWLLRLRGMKNVLCTKAHIKHYAESSSRKLGSFRVFLQERNRWINTLCHYSILNLIRLFPLAVLNVIGIFVMDWKNVLPRIKAHLWLWSHIPYLISRRNFVQSQRKVPDTQILPYISCKFYEEYIVSPGITRYVVRLMNTVQYLYCLIMGLRTIEWYSHKNGVINLKR